MMTFLYVLLFIVFLSILIVVHELGHLTAAKLFNVYCHDFSIGFGPAFVHHRRKNGETYFSMRVIPFGGFVSMYGEGAEELDEFKNVDPSRSLANQKRWKQAIIFVAGVTMNVVLALIILFISEQACVHYRFSVNWARINENSLAAQAGVTEDKGIFMRTCVDKDGNSTNYVWLCNEAYLDDNTTNKYWVCLDQTKINRNNLDYNNFICVFGSTTGKPDSKGVPTVIADFNAVNLSQHQTITFTITNCEYEVETKDGINYLKVKSGTEEPHLFNKISLKDGKIPALGMKIHLEEYWNDYKGTKDKNGIYDDHNALRKTFVDFGNSATAIFRGLGSLFTSGLDNVGGIVAIGVTTTQTLENFGIAQFLFYWGMISVNLAIINLFPFPGLDGWHLVVTAVEGITRKKIPQKAKSIASIIGLALLFSLMIAIIIKDIIRFAI